ncbi:hypothetical protein [Variovorax sp. WS11]|uniref:hypothetical protein n=1 Tax=Variovorax sp. WS11 TaxID=1105204 RepID=UPI0011B23F51|nr:hypothetical protein [Variovorax sp. WS11]NDZ16972.1 hypothetical protein [Variovorax sp. WS11]
MNLAKITAVVVFGFGISAGNVFAADYANLSYSKPTDLIASTGNLYWTSYSEPDDVLGGPSVASIWRAGNNSKPGGERLLYSESSNGYKPFGNIVYANLGAWYGYFIANDQSSPLNKTSTIKRIPLAGGSATTIATLSRFVGNRSLRTDEEYLYWVDEDGVRRMPIGGGSIQTLATTTAGHHLELGTNFAYYSDGNVIRRVLKSGSATNVVASSPEPISALFIYPISGGTRIFWGSEGGGVYSRDVGSTLTRTYKATTTGYRTTSVGFDGTRVLWARCTDSGSDCSVGIQSGGETRYNVGVGISRVGFANLQWDATQVFWGSVSGIHKYVH